ncbi:MAG: BatA domain-containing protein [Thermoguttaceae bacterium]|nr:BatA domain-containing protein [Thermoguttaceae bacterium]MDW8037759.1 BatA domain-containing protein [Thermoguttaceae bacterium]
MSSFLYPGAWVGAVAAAVLIAVPIIIHLINMMRHRRIEWAAMEFLLISQKKNRTWIILKQLLLLLMRMAAVAAVVFLVPHPRLQSELGRLLGSVKTHHLILLDDSYSMSDRGAAASAFEKAKEVVYRIAEAAMAQPTPQEVTLLRFSQAERAGNRQPDLLQVPVDTQFLQQVKDKIGPVEVSQTAVGPLPALKAVSQLLGEEEQSGTLMVYLVSDFRTKEWAAPTDIKEELLRLQQRGARIFLIQCVERMHDNLTITSLAPLPGVRAVGAEIFMELAVTNYGTSPRQNVSVFVEGEDMNRQTRTIAKIAPGQTVRERVALRFEKPGQHAITARLEPDPVGADNYRYAVLDVPRGVPVLIIDGDPAASEGRFIALALESDQLARTGISPQIEQPRFLSLRPAEELSKFHAIYLVNIERLDSSAIDTLEKYVKAGGGLIFFLGPLWRTKFINEELYKDGQGLFPMPVASPTLLRVDYLQRVPDIEVVDPQDPILGILANERYRFFQSVIVEQYFATPKDWKPAAESGVQIRARLRNGAPLVVEKSYGKGKVIAFTTTAAPLWNNWAKDPSFVITLLQLQAYLGHQPTGDESRQVGSPLEVVVALAPESSEGSENSASEQPKQPQKAKQLKPQVRIIPPGGSEGLPQILEAVERPDRTVGATFLDTFRQGIYRVEVSRVGLSPETHLYAYNVDPAEGDLKLVSREQLVTLLEPIQFTYSQADVFQYQAEETGTNLFQVLLYGLIVLLVVEQLLAYSASYHPAKSPATAKD